MPKSRDEIRNDPVASRTWVSPHFGDGGWHTQPGALGFDPRQIEPTRDRILVELATEAQSGVIITPEGIEYDRQTRIGTVLKIGPGKWYSGKYWQQRKPMTLKPGDKVVIGPWSDWESWDAWAPGANIVLCQEADVRLHDPL